jgi:hypothetical protein
MRADPGWIFLKTSASLVKHISYRLKQLSRVLVTLKPVAQILSRRR